MSKTWYFTIFFLLLSACELEELKEVECSQGQLSCGGQCVEITTNYHCGACDVRCKSSESCQSRDGRLQCVPICVDDNQIVCQGQCVDIRSKAHCGFCGNACKGNERCEKSGDTYVCAKIKCESPLIDCDSACVPPSKNNCGLCGNKCSEGKICQQRGENYLCTAENCAKPNVLTPSGDCLLPNTKFYCGDDASPCPENIGDCIEKKGESQVFECLDHCNNGRKDRDEVAVDCGGSRCKACRACAVNTDKDKFPCGEGEFCDSAVGYFCSKKCKPDNGVADTPSVHCPGEDRICRADGRCSSKYFVTEWTLDKADDLEIRLFIASDIACNFHVDWGDGSKEHITECNDKTLKHRYDKAGVYRVKLDGKYGKWSYENIPEKDSQDRRNIASKLTGVLSFGTVVLGQASFRYCVNLNKVPDDDIPDASALTDTRSMFDCEFQLFNYDSNLSKFNQNIGHWDVSNVTNMSKMFQGASNFNQDIGKWDVSNVKDMSSMFSGASSFNQDIGKWNVSNVTDMSSMFSVTSSFNQDIGKWNVANVTYMRGMFSFASSFNQDIGKWNVANVTDMSRMFSYASKFDQDLSAWNLKSIKDIADIFKDSALDPINYCKMLKNNDWTKFKDILGIQFDCP